MSQFDPAFAVPGQVQHDIDASSLHSSKDALEQWRIDLQHQLIATQTLRWDIIQVNCAGVILAGHHGARAAAEAGVPIDVRIVDLPMPSRGLILTIRVVPSLNP